MEKVFINIWCINYFFAKLDEKGSLGEYVELFVDNKVSTKIRYNVGTYSV